MTKTQKDSPPTPSTSVGNSTAPATTPTSQALRPYDWRVDEWLLVGWFYELLQSGDMNVTFTPDMRFLSNFLGMFRSRATLGYSADEKGIWFAFWVEPCISGAFAGAWIRKDKRTSLAAVRAFREGINEAFKVFTVLIGLCKQEELRSMHQRLGYKQMGTVPGLWYGEDVDVWVLTQDDWKKGFGKKQ